MTQAVPLSAENAVTASNKKKLGVWMCSALVVGNMIGSGIFLLPATLASYGTISLGGWLFTGAGAVLLALVFSRMSQVVPSTGGPYTYSRVGLGKFMGFLIAWGYWIGLWSGNAAIVVAMVGYLGIFFPQVVENPMLGAGVAISAIWLITWVNCRGVQSAGKFQLITTILKLLPLALVTFAGLFYINPEHFSAANFNISGEGNFAALSSTAALCLWAFLGLESACVPSEDVENPKRTIPMATTLGTLFAAVLYIIATVSLMGLIDPSTLANSTAPFADAANQLVGPAGAMIVGLGAIISCLGALNGWTLMAAQIPMAASRDGLFPSIFGKLSSKGVPAGGIIISSILVSLLVAANFNKGLVGAFNFIISLAVMTTLLPYTMTTISKLVLMMGRHDKSGKPMLETKDIVITSLAFLYSLWALAGSGQETVYWGFLLLIAGIPVYALIEWQKRKGQSEEFVLPAVTLQD
ncbi:amino acid permease [Parendozoicomonas haliclonae]|uniref:Arginine/agmatine antiporter n=1 Tax=Parendozoicomonas haliclonae TaxID=1960125 RepID=A0A1X7AII1_9GAMM|nr:amino acid permease [Parendozoicomonas haliclonae]SMA43418.1 Arginine/agmatine antiporter [Parendozoicomonas haliclonae]